MRKVILLAVLFCSATVFAQLSAKVVNKPDRLGVTQHSVVLTWKAGTSGVNNAATGFNVKRGGTTISSVTATVLTYTDSSAAVQVEGASFTYTITATNTAGESAPSNPATVTIPITIVAPNPPTLDPPVVN